MWTAYRDPGGYGRIRGDGRSRHAHRVSFMLAQGREAAAGMFVVHTCGVRACVNPEHLKEVRNGMQGGGPIPRPLAARFWEKVDFGNGKGCWLWKASRNPDGYGSIGIGVGTKVTGAHRASYELMHGPILDGLHVRHSCDNPPCVNPAHLSLGTNADNMADKVKRNRTSSARGDTNGNSKLCDDDVREIRRLRADKVLLRTIASQFDISVANVSDIARRRIWKHVD